MTRLRQSSASSFAARLVEPTRSQNITVIGRRSAAISETLAGPGLAGGLGEIGVSGPAVAGVADLSSEIASSSFLRCPTLAIPSSFRSSPVRRGRTSASTELSRNAASYCSRPKLRSQAPTSMREPPFQFHYQRGEYGCPEVGQATKQSHLGVLRRQTVAHKALFK